MSTTDIAQQEFWDDELARLTKDAAAIYGAPAVTELVEAAVSRLVSGSRDQTALTGSEVRTTLKAALRRLLTLH